MRFTCCLNMGFNFTIIEMSPNLFACCYMKSFASQTDHFGNTFVHKNVAHKYDVMTFKRLQLIQVCLENSSIRNGTFKWFSGVLSVILIGIG